MKGRNINFNFLFEVSSQKKDSIPIDIRDDLKPDKPMNG